MPSSFIEVCIPAVPPLTEHLIGIFGQLGFEGFWEDEGCLRAYMQSARWSPALREEVESTVRIVARSSGTPVPQVSISQLDHRNWNEEWERTIRPIAVTDRITIAPTWHPLPVQPGTIVLTIDPKMSFGTGYHESTRLALQLMQDHLLPGIRMLDVGTGTGVLAIAALKLGAATAMAIDIDEWSFENAVENARLNNVEHRLVIRQGEIAVAKGEFFHMVVANIQRNVLEKIMKDLAAALSPGGLLLLSGLLSGDRDSMVASMSSCGIVLLEERSENEWIGLAGRKGS